MCGCGVRPTWQILCKGGELLKKKYVSKNNGHDVWIPAINNY